MIFTVEQCEQALTEHDLDMLEQQLGKVFPPAYREHFLQYNGGYLSEEWMERGRLGFGGFNEIRYGKVPAEQLYADLLECFPELEYLFPFAYDQGGNSFLISLREGTDYGEIYIWMMDEKELAPVADSFEHFWWRLKTEIDDSE
ncbi:SMI1/KNR4 family protein [Paenibacillus sp. WLX2291]|uniref:SMI1/KNR4 family protein n=1 Tax=Paenibacillus sp. WLX2291 TaxID=3296934 RepID=UPI003983FD16